MSQDTQKDAEKAKRKNRYTIKDGETPTQFAARVYATEGAEHYKLSDDQKKGLEDKLGIGGLSITEFAEVAQGGDGIHDPFIMKNYGEKIKKDHMPQYKQVPVNMNFNDLGIRQEGKPFTAETEAMFGSWVPITKLAGVKCELPNSIKTASKKKGVGGVFLWPKYWQNPYQYQDYLVLQDNYANTIAGRILDVIVYFTLANGIKPKLEPKDKSLYKDDKALTKALDDAKWVTTVFEQIDQQISEGKDPMPYATFDDDKNVQYVPKYVKADRNTPTYDTPFQQKWASFTTLALNFGRGAMVPNVDPDDNTVEFKIDGKDHKYVGIPKIFQIIHPRDLGFNHVDPTTWKLLGIQVYNSNWILRPDQMLFMEWNPNNPVYGSMYYGYSVLQSMMGSARTLRRIIEVDFPLIAKTRWSGMYWLFFTRKGEGSVTAQAEHAAILSAIKLDGINISLEDNPQEDVRVENIDLDPKITELIEMCKFLIQYMMSQVSMPQGLLFGEQDLNRDTLKTGIQTFTKGPIKKYRRWVLHTATQYYRRMAATVIPQNPKIGEVLEEFNLIANVDEFNLESDSELAQALIIFQQAIGATLTTEAKAEWLEKPNLAQMIDPDSKPEDIPQGGGSKMNIQDKQSGKNFEVSS